MTGQCNGSEKWERCRIYAGELALLHSAITVVEGKVDKLIEIINGNDGYKGLRIEVDRNTQFRLEMEANQRGWKKLLPSVIGGVLVGLIMLFFNMITAGSVFGEGLPEIWVSGHARKNAEQHTVGAVSAGFKDNRLLWERQSTSQGLLDGWGYDLDLSLKKSFYQAGFWDLYRQNGDISLQVQSLTVGRDFRGGLASAGDKWRSWKAMAALEADYAQGWLNINTRFYTDLSQYRWSVKGGLEVPLSSHFYFGPQLDYCGTQKVTVGGGELKLLCKFRE